MRLSSILHISSVLANATWSPNRLTSTAPTCSTKTLVASPLITISGRKVAGRALLDVGATRTTERGSIASACTTTPKRRLCCSCPVRRGGRSSNTSPLCTKALHQSRDLVHLPAIRFVRFQHCDLRTECLWAAKGSSSVEDRLANCLRSGHAGSLQRPERSLHLVIQSDRHRVSHGS